ncbi:HlyD family type I secretion periplasmic adaptor subunit [Phenylobacterium hankyongense]|nr:HlyD family type I secretion periplasmic adaptor subunit [Phenylobacterium hankyongense]
MKLDIQPHRSSYVAPTFGDDRVPLDPRLEQRMRRPMVVGAAIIGTLVVGLGLWASLTPLSTGVTAPAEVRVEANRKTLRHREGGTVRQILVREGQHVTAGQPLILFDDVEARASNDVFQNQADSMMSQAARLTAEATNRPNLEFPPELTSRISDPRVASMIRDQQFLFATRLQLFQSQGSVLDQRLDQIRNQIVGNQAQVASVDEQRKLTAEEMAGYQTLYEKGFAPKPLILRYQRSIADLDGRKGSLLADIARLHQQMGETNMNLATLRDQRQSQAAEQLRDTQSKIADVMPRLAAAKQTLASTVVRSPVDGYVFNLTQFTLGGVTSPGEVLMDVVPANSPLMVTATIKPEDIEEVHVGMDARVRITGLNQRWVSPLPAKVAVVSADRITNEKTGLAFYRVDLRIDPKELTNLKRGAQVTPGMGAQAMIVTGKRTIMGFLISPITDTLHDAFREQ